MSLIKIKSILDEDFIQYKKPSMFIIFPYCTLKCGQENCQNSSLLFTPNINIEPNILVTRYLNNPLTSSIVIGGLEPFDTFEDLIDLITAFRERTNDDIVIYTGYNKNELTPQLFKLNRFPNIIIKYGRYIAGQKAHYDNILGVKLASDNQYGEVLTTI